MDNSKYNSKRDDSFKTKYKIFLFKKAFEINKLDDLIDAGLDLVTEFEKFVVNPEIANLYSSEYYQKEDNEEITYNGKTIICSVIWNVMNIYKDINMFNLIDSKKQSSAGGKYVELYRNLKKNHNENFQNHFSLKDFNCLLENKECSYCGVSKDAIANLGKEKKLHNKRSETRGYSLEIDRKFPNLEYTKDNCCMSCYWCNNAKTDEFIPSEFKEIARGINLIWKRRGADIKDFNEEAEIWKSDEPK